MVNYSDGSIVSKIIYKKNHSILTLYAVDSYKMLLIMLK